MHANVSHVYAGGQKRALDALELERQVPVSYTMLVLGPNPRALKRAVVAHSLSPSHLSSPFYLFFSAATFFYTRDFF